MLTPLLIELWEQQEQVLKITEEGTLHQNLKIFTQILQLLSEKQKKLKKRSNMVLNFDNRLKHKKEQKRKESNS